jgi:hypothetical protein
MTHLMVPDELAQGVDAVYEVPMRPFCGGHDPWMPFVNDAAAALTAQYMMWREHEVTYEDLDASDEEYEHYRLSMWTEAFTDLYRIIRAHRAAVDATVFIDWGYVTHNINMTGDDAHPYINGAEALFNKELVVLVKQPGEALTMSLVRKRMKLVESCVRDLHAYHTARRSCYFEGFKVSNVTSIHVWYQTMMDLDVGQLRGYDLCMAMMARKYTTAYPERGEWAEHSSREFHRLCLAGEPDPASVVVVCAQWGS